MNRAIDWLAGDPRRACLAVFLLFLALFVTVSRPFEVLLIPQASLVLGERSRDVAEWTEARGGEYVLPPATRDGLALLRDHAVARFWVSEGVASQPLVLGRLIDSAVPSLPDRQAAERLFYKFEVLPAGCRILAERGALRLAHCD